MTLQSALSSLNARYAEITSLVENLYKFSDLGYNNYSISDGGDDMWDSGNKLATEEVEGGEDEDIYLAYTHTQDTGGGEDEVIPYENTPMDGEIVTSTQPASSDEYFTNMYPGLFVWGVSNPENILIDGNHGSDGNTIVTSSDDNQSVEGGEDSEMTATGKVFNVGGSNFTVFTRYNKEFNDDELDGDPTIHHIVIVPGTNNAWEHRTNLENDTYQDTISFNGNRPEVAFFLLFAVRIGTGDGPDGGGEDQGIGGLPVAENVFDIIEKMIEILFGAVVVEVVEVTQVPVHPTYTFEVMAFNPVQILGSDLIGSYDSVVTSLKQKTVHIETVPGHHRHGDRFTVQGRQALYLKRTYVDVADNSNMKLLKIVE